MGECQVKTTDYDAMIPCTGCRELVRIHIQAPLQACTVIATWLHDFGGLCKACLAKRNEARRTQ